MKKTLIASAIAAATFSGAAMAQDTMTASQLAEKMDSMPSLYGNIQLAVSHDNHDGGPSETKHFDNGSTLGVLHDHQITSGVEGFFKAELHFDADDNNGENDGIYEIDEAYVGVRGDNFGQIWVGKDDSTYESAVDEIAQYYEAATLSKSVGYSTGEGDLIQYLSPSFSGFKLGAAVQYNGDNDTKGSDEKSFPFQLAAMYEVDALELAFAVDSNDNGNGSNENTYGLRASYNLDNLRLTGEYHTTKDAQDKLGIMGIYTLGANTFALSYEMLDKDADNSDEDVVTLQAKHSLSDNMYVWVEGYLGGGDDVYRYTNQGAAGENDTPVGVTDERSVAAVGAVYYF